MDEINPATPEEEEEEEVESLTPRLDALRKKQEDRADAQEDLAYRSLMSAPPAISGLSINAPTATPGVLSSMGKGALEGMGMGIAAPYLNDVGGRGLDPTTLTEQIAFGGTAAGVNIGIMLLTRAPMYSGLRAVMGARYGTRVLAEFGGGGVADAIYVLGQKAETGEVPWRDAGMFAAANLMASVLLPFNPDKVGKVIAEAGERLGKESVETLTDEVTHKLYKDLEIPDFTEIKPKGKTIYSTPEAQTVFDKAPTTIEGHMDVVSQSVNKYWDDVELMTTAVKRKILKDTTVIPPGRVTNVAKTFVSKRTNELFEQLDYQFSPFDAQYILKRLRDIPAEEVNSIPLAGVERHLRKIIGEYTLPVVSRGAKASGSEHFLKSVDNWVDDLIAGSERLDWHLPPGLADDVFQAKKAKYQDMLQALEVKKSTEYGILKQEIRTGLDAVKRGDAMVPVGFANSASVKTFMRTMPDLLEMITHDTSVLKAELEEITSVIKRADSEKIAKYREGVSMMFQRQPLGAMKRYEEIITALERGDNQTVQSVLNANAHEINMAVAESLQRKLKDQLHLIDPQVGLDAEMKAQQALFLPPEDAAKQLLEAEHLSQQVVRQVLENPAVARQIADTTTDPHLKNLINTYHAILGDPTAVATIRNMKAPAHNIAHSIDTKAVEREVAHHSPGPDAHAGPSVGSRGGGTGGGAGGGDAFKQELDTAAKELTTEDRFANTKVNTNWFTRFLESPLTHMKALIAKAPSAATKKILELGHAAMTALARARRAYLRDTLEVNQRWSDILDSWEAMGKNGRQIMRNVVDEVAHEADAMVREGKHSDEIDAWIDKYIGKQSAEVQDKYREFRQFMDDEYELTNKSIDAHNAEFGTNIPHIPKRPGYVHFHYDGQWVVTIQKKNGHAPSVVVNDNDDLAKAINELMARGTLDTGDIANINIEPKWFDAVDDYEIADSILKDASTFDVDVSELRKAYDITTGGFQRDTVGNVVLNSMKKRMVGVEALRSNTEVAVSISTRLNRRFQHMSIPAIRIKQVAGQMDQVNLHAVADDMRSYANDVLGRSGDLERKVDKFVESFVDHIFKFQPAKIALEGMGIHHNGRVVRNFASMMTFMGRMMTIGFNPATAMVQWLIVPTNVAPVLGWKNVMKGMRSIPEFTKPGSRWHKLAQRGGVYLQEGEGWSTFFKREGRGGSGVGMQERLTKPRALMSKAEKFQDNADYYSMWMFNESENMIRSASLYAGVLDAEQRGARLAKGAVAKSHQDKRLVEIAKTLNKDITDEAVQNQYALDMMLDLNFDFDVTGLSRFARNPFTKVAAQFKTYFSQELEFLFGRKMDISHMERFQSLAMFTTFGGLMAMPFAEDLNNIATWVYGKNPRLWMYENLPDVVLGGLPAVAGVSLTDSVALGGAKTLSPLTSMMSLKQGVAINKLYQMYDRVHTGRMGLPEAFFRSNTTMNRVLDAYDLWTTGQVRKSSGIVESGNKITALSKVLGVDTRANFVNRDLFYLNRAANYRGMTENRAMKREIFDSSNPDQTALAYIKQGKLTPALYKRWVTERGKDWRLNLADDYRALTKEGVQDYGY